MILKTLTVKAFSSFRAEQRVDLTKYLGSIFVVTGDTGAGKTSLFDAIMFSLYGVPSGSVRSEGSLRNQSATEDENSFTELVFEQGGVEYTVHRELKNSTRNSRKDDHWIKWDAPDGYINGKKLVTDKVIKVLGFTAEAFRRVSVLAQGEFAEFLHMNSGDKEKVLRDIFRTDVYEQFEKLVKERASSSRDECARHSAVYKAYLAQISMQIDDELIKEIDRFEELKKLYDEWESATQESLSALEKERDKLSEESAQAVQAVEKGRAFNARFDELDAARSEVKSLQSESKDVEDWRKSLSDSVAAERVLPAQNTAEEKRKALLEQTTAYNEAIALLNTAETALAVAQSNIGERDSLNAEKELLLKQQPAVQALSELFEKHEQRTGEMSISMVNETRRHSELEQAQKKRDELLAEQNSLSEEINGLTDTVQGLSVAERELLAAQSGLEECDRLIGAMSVLKSSQQEHEGCIKAQSKADEELKVAAAQAAEIVHAYYADMAGALAQNLVEGEKCPVCGAKEHPAPAERCENAPTKEEKERIEQTVERLTSAKNTADKALARAEAEFTAAEKSAFEAFVRVFGKGEESLSANAREMAVERKTALSESIDRYQKTVDECRKAEKTLVEKKKRQEQLSEEQKATATLCEEASRNYAAAEENYNRAKVEYQAVDKQLKSALEVLTLPDGWEKPEWNTVAETLRKIEDRILRIGQLVEGYETALSKAQTDLAIASATAQQTEQAKIKSEKDLQLALTELERTATEQGFSDAEQALSALLSEEDVNTLQQKCDSFIERMAKANGLLESLEKELADKERVNTAELETLSAELSGKLSELTEEIGSRRNKAENDLRTMKKLADMAQEYGDTHKRLALLERLNSLVSGKRDVTVSQTVKLTFERYVQGYMFDEVLNRANVRLAELSDGRYAFRRRAASGNGTKTQGLDLDIIDLNLGKNNARDVSSLSGGESFLASFALAIALSDYTMEENGGRRTDILFVDEGFSSLDVNTFEMAMGAICKVSSPERLVGFVSHIAAIREHFKDEIYIKKEVGGSRIVQR